MVSMVFTFPNPVPLRLTELTDTAPANALPATPSVTTAARLAMNSRDLINRVDVWLNVWPLLANATTLCVSEFAR